MPATTQSSARQSAVEPPTKDKLLLVAQPLVLLPLGVALGVMAGYFKSWADDAIQYLYTTLNSIPGVLLIAAFVLMLANQALRLGNRRRARVQPELGRRPGNRGALPRLLAGSDQEHAPRLGR